MATGTRPAKDLTDLASRVCRTTDGDHIPPADAIAAILQGQIRRVIVDSTSTVIDLGRKRRLFTGNARDAVMLRSTTCIWPGCDRPASGCQTDHITGWSEHGSTDAANGVLMCGPHNRFKARGYTITPTAGRWRITRPDGTHIHAPPAA